MGNLTHKCSLLTKVLCQEILAAPTRPFWPQSSVGARGGSERWAGRVVSEMPKHDSRRFCHSNLLCAQLPGWASPDTPLPPRFPLSQFLSPKLGMAMRASACSVCGACLIGRPRPRKPNLARKIFQSCFVMASWAGMAPSPCRLRLGPSIFML
jgi:hypothetical protein